MAQNVAPDTLTDEQMGITSAPDILTDEQMGIKSSAQSVKTPGLFGTPIGKNTGWMALLRAPSAIVKGVSQGMMDAYEPQTQSVPLNAVLRTPETLASIGGELASQQITPEALTVQGAAKAAPLLAKPAGAVGKWIAGAAEGFSGTESNQPGALVEGFKRPSLFVGQGTEAAGENYANLVDRTQVRDSMKGMQTFKDIVSTGEDALKDGSLTPDEAFVARKALDRVRNSLPKDNFFELRDGFDQIAKTKFFGADQAFKDALVSEALREPLPITQSGKPSRWLTGLGAMGLGTAIKTGNPAYAILGAATSPMVQGATASGLGLAAKGLSPFIQNPAIPAGLSSYLMNRGNQ